MYKVAKRIASEIWEGEKLQSWPKQMEFSLFNTYIKAIPPLPPPGQGWDHADTANQSQLCPEGGKGERELKKTLKWANSIYFWPGLSVLSNWKKFCKREPKNYSKSLSQTSKLDQLDHAVFQAMWVVHYYCYHYWKSGWRCDSLVFKCRAKNSNFYSILMRNQYRKSMKQVRQQVWTYNLW